MQNPHAEAAPPEIQRWISPAPYQQHVGAEMPTINPTPNIQNEEQQQQALQNLSEQLDVLRKKMTDLGQRQRELRSTIPLTPREQAQRQEQQQIEEPQPEPQPAAPSASSSSSSNQPKPKQWEAAKREVWWPVFRW